MSETPIRLTIEEVENWLSNKDTGGIVSIIGQQLLDTMRKVESMKECDKAAAIDIMMLIKSRDEYMIENERLLAACKGREEGKQIVITQLERENERLRSALKKIAKPSLDGKLQQRIAQEALSNKESDNG